MPSRNCNVRRSSQNIEAVGFDTRKRTRITAVATATRLEASARSTTTVTSVGDDRVTATKTMSPGMAAAALMPAARGDVTPTHNG